MCVCVCDKCALRVYIQQSERDNDIHFSVWMWAVCVCVLNSAHRLACVSIQLFNQSIFVAIKLCVRAACIREEYVKINSPSTG